MSSNRLARAALSARRRATRMVRSSELFVVYGVLLVMFVSGAFTTPEFATQFNLQSALAASVPLGLVAIGQTVVVIAGGIDLSVGSMMGLTSIVGAMYMNGHDGRIASGVALCLVIGAGLGLFNGLVITVLRLQPIVATLGSLSIIEGLALLRNKTPGGLTPPGLQNLSYENMLYVPKSVYVLAAAFVLGFVVLRRTRYGMQLYA